MVSESDEITGGSMSEDSPEVVGDTCINSTNNPSVSRLGNLCFNYWQCAGDRVDRFEAALQRQPETKELVILTMLASFYRLMLGQAEKLAKQ